MEKRGREKAVKSVPSDASPDVVLKGREARNSSPIKSWSGGMSIDEVQAWESIAEKCRRGTKPTIAAESLGLRQTYLKHRREGHPVHEFILTAWAEGRDALLSKIQDAESWQASAWMLERQAPEEFALDNALRQTILGWAQEAGLEVADLADLIRIVKEAKELEISLWDVLEEAKQRAKAVRGL